MSTVLASFALPASPVSGAMVLRAGKVVWRRPNSLVVLDADGSREITTPWRIDDHEVTADGRFVIALGDDGKRAAVWETGNGRRLIDIVGEENARQSLRAGLIVVDKELFVLRAVRNADMSIIAVADGTERAWIVSTGSAWFHVLRIAQLDEHWLALLGYRGDDQYNTVVAIAAHEAMRDPMVLSTALTKSQTAGEWGYRLAAGPAGIGRAVVFRDPDWGDDELPDDPTDAFRGLIIRDLVERRVIQRIEYDADVDFGSTLGADAALIAIAVGDRVDVIERSTNSMRRVMAVALDPYRMEIARIDDGRINIVKL